MSKQNKCKYCGKVIKENICFCNELCHENYNKQLASDQRQVKYFIVGLIIGIIGVLISVILNNNTTILGISIMFLGFIIILMPFTTPETNIMFGYIKSRRVGRMMGVVLEAVGIWIACT